MTTTGKRRQAIPTKSRGDHLRELLDDYVKDQGVTEIEWGRVYAWAVAKGRYTPPPHNVVRIFKQEISRAAREDYEADPQGRTVRKWHAMKVGDGPTQRYIWSDMANATPEHMRGSLQLRRCAILSDCQQLKTDQDSYNENHNTTGNPVQLDFNFEADLAETAESSTYSDVPPDEPSPSTGGGI